MIAVLWAVLTDWKEHSGLTLSLLIGTVALTGMFSLMRPEVYCEFIMLILIWLGVQIGRHIWLKTSIRDWIFQGGVSPVAFMFATVTGAVIISAVHLLVIMPSVVLIIKLWGIPPVILGKIFLLTLTASVTSSSFGLLGFLILDGQTENNHFGEFFVGIWMMITFAAKDLNIINPLIQVWKGSFPDGAGLLLQSIFYHCLLFLVVLSVAGFLVGRWTKKR